jgi:hypothetical protein
MVATIVCSDQRSDWLFASKAPSILDLRGVFQLQSYLPLDARPSGDHKMNDAGWPITFCYVSPLPKMLKIYPNPN